MYITNYVTCFSLSFHSAQSVCVTNNHKQSPPWLPDNGSTFFLSSATFLTSTNNLPTHTSCHQSPAGRAEPQPDCRRNERRRRRRSRWMLPIGTVSLRDAWGLGHAWEENCACHLAAAAGRKWHLRARRSRSRGWRHTLWTREGGVSNTVEHQVCEGKRETMLMFWSIHWHHLHLHTTSADMISCVCLFVLKHQVSWSWSRSDASGRFSPGTRWPALTQTGGWGPSISLGEPMVLKCR